MRLKVVIRLYSVSRMDKGGSDSISVTINLTQAPEFTDGTSTTRSIDEGTAAGVNIGIRYPQQMQRVVP